jgi:hypothetical protein
MIKVELAKVLCAAAGCNKAGIVCIKLHGDNQPPLDPLCKNHGEKKAASWVAYYKRIEVKVKRI